MLLSSSDGSVKDVSVPLEIFGHILKNFTRDSASSRTELKSFCLVSKCWVAACRLRLFQEVQIGLPEGNKTARIRLAQYLNEDPTIATFIRHIKYTLPNNILNEEAEAVDEHLAGLLQLPNVQCLTISCFRKRYPAAGTHHFGWRSLLDHYVSLGQLTSISLTGIISLPFLQFFSSASLENLELRDCAFAMKSRPTTPPAHVIATGFKLLSFKAQNVKNLWLPLLALCSRLEDLDIDNLLLDTRNTESFFDTHAPVTFPRVTTFSVCGIQGWETLLETAHNSAAIVFPSMKTLKIQISNPEHEIGVSELYPHIRGLERLEVAAISGAFELDSIDLHALTMNSQASLTHVSLSVQLTYDDYMQRSRNSICGWLASIEGHNALQSFKIQYHIWASTEYIYVGGFEEFSPFGEVFANISEDFPLLKDVSVGITFGCPLEEEDIWDCLPHDEFDYRDILEYPLRQLAEAPGITFKTNIVVEFDPECPPEVLEDAM